MIFSIKNLFRIWASLSVIWIAYVAYTYGAFMYAFGVGIFSYNLKNFVFGYIPAFFGPPFVLAIGLFLSWKIAKLIKNSRNVEKE